MILASFLFAALVQLADPLDGVSPAQCNQTRPLPVSELVELWRKDPIIGLSDDLFHWLGGTPAGLAEAIDRCRTDFSPRSCASLAELGAAADALAETPRRPGGALTAVRGDLPDDGQGLLRDHARLEIRCTAEAPQGAAASMDEESGGRAWRVALDLGNLLKQAEREFGTFSITDDVKKDETTEQVEIAFGRRFRIEALDGHLMPYLSADVLSADDADKQADLIEVGAALDWRLFDADTRNINANAWEFAVGAAFLTDTGRDAEGSRAFVRIAPGLSLPGYRVNRAVEPFGPLEFGWNASVQLDHLDIQEAGAAFGEDDESFTRFGADISAVLQFDKPVYGAVPRFSASAGFREPLNEGETLSRYTLTAELLPEAESSFSFGLSYESGDDFESLKFSQALELRLGVRY